MRPRPRHRPLLGRAALVVACALAGTIPFPASAFAQADLAIEVADSADPVLVGSEFVYGIGVANGGAETATGVTVETTLANEVDFVSATPSQGTCTLQGSKRVDCELGQLASGQSATIDVRVRAQRDGQASTTATVASQSPADPNPANDSSTEATTIQEPAPVSCGGRTADVVGTAGDDTLTGTDKADVIAGLGGADKIVGLDGNDLVCGGTGDDRLKLGAGNDSAKGGGDNDRLRGSTGADALRGNGGDDNLGGGPDDDSLKGGPGTDRCAGGPGADARRGCE
jgi:uncharacterized repeat protein (TIGR01451 family)